MHHADDAAGCSSSSSNATVLPIAAGHTWALPQLWPFCFYNWRAPSFRLSTIPHHLASTEACDAPSSFRLAIGLGGLARTLPHPLVYKTLRGHLIEPWNKTHSSRRQQAPIQIAVLAALRLDDQRAVAAGGGPGMGTAMSRVSEAAIWRALNYLSADPRDVSIEANASTPLPSCLPSNSNSTSGPCSNYADPCALPVVAGQLWSRIRIYNLLVAHEAREGYTFDALLFMRPDLAIVVPVPPPSACTLSTLFPSSSAASIPVSSYTYADWLAWLPRSHVQSAFKRVSDDFHTCSIRFAYGVTSGLNPEKFLVHAAKVNGVEMRPFNEATRDLIISIVRPPSLPNQPPPPYGFLCSDVANLLKSAAEVSGHTNATLLSPVKGAFQPLVYKGKSAEGRFPPSYPTCTRLLVSNPANAIGA